MSSQISPKNLPNWFFMLLALLCGYAMWHAINMGKRIEAQLEVNLDYNGIPDNLVVTNGLVNKISVRVRGSEALLRSITRDKLNRPVDLSFIKKGETIVPFPSSDLTPDLRAFEIIDIQPPRLEITADNIMERSVSVRPTTESPLRSGALTVENISVSPSTVIVRGPESIVSDISSIPLTVPIDPKKVGRPVDQILPLDTPSLVSATPSSVRARYVITSGRVTVTRRCQIAIAEDNNHHYSITPREITINVEVPEALSKTASYLNSLEASVTPPPLEIGESKRVKINIRPADGMTVTPPANDEVTVTRISN